MRLALWGPLFLISFALVAAPTAERIEGSWVVKYASGIEYKTIGGAEFTFHVEDAALTGMASVGIGWPGHAPISEGKVNGEHIDFMVYGQLGSTGGYPKMHFVGVISGDNIQISMVRIFDGEPDGRNVARFEGRRAAPGEVAIPPAIGTLINGRYHHDLTGIEFAPSADWSGLFQNASSDGGQQISFSQLKPRVEASVWLKPHVLAAAKIPDALQSAMKSKEAVRQKTLERYRLLADTVENKTVGGQPALTVQAEYYTASGDRMIEYHTWVKSEKTQVYLAARASAKDFANVKGQIDALLATFSVP